MTKKTPTLSESAKRNTKVDPKRVAKFEKTIKALQKRGIIQKAKYDITAPFGNSERKSTKRKVTIKNQQQVIR